MQITPMSEWLDGPNQWMPWILLIAIMLLLVIPLALIIILLPSGAFDADHPLHKVWEFVAFDFY